MTNLLHYRQAHRLARRSLIGPSWRQLLPMSSMTACASPMFVAA